MEKIRRHPVLKFTASLALLVAGLILVTGCGGTPDPTEGPNADVSLQPWTRPESWEGNPYGNFFPGSR